MSQPPRVAVIAGGGALPRALVQGLEAEGRHPFVIALRGITAATTVEGFDHAWIRLGASAKMLAALKSRNIFDVVLIGSLRRPSLAELRPDWTTLSFFLRYARGVSGDDGLLRAVRRFLEDHGVRLHGAHSLLPRLLAPAGMMGSVTPSDSDVRDIQRGVEVLRALSPLDIGQGVVVQGGFVLGVEAAEGTDALIARCGSLRRKGGGGVLVKLCKAGQDRDLDMPAIGPGTIRALVQAGLAGVAVEAGGVLLAEADEMIAVADENKIFIMGIDGL